MTEHVKGGHGGSSKDDGHHLSDKLKHPFHELKEKLHNTHLHDAKVWVHHEK
jgi:phospholipase D1/2